MVGGHHNIEGGMRREEGTEAGAGGVMNRGYAGGECEDFLKRRSGGRRKGESWCHVDLRSWL